MQFRPLRRIAVPGILSIPLVASLALAQRPAAPAQPRSPLPSQLKLPATPPAPQAPHVRDTQGRAAARTAPQKSPALDAQHTSYRLPTDQLYVSTQADGSPQVRARTYKAEFTPAGASYIPFCGSAAPQSHPLTFRIDSITSGGQPVAFADSVVAGLDGQTVAYARGGVTEVYGLGLDSLEQKFVFDSLPSTGDLAVRLALATDMSASIDGEAILFSSADGTVRYGQATVVDAHGRSAPALTELDGQSLEIQVPASFLEGAAFPVTIDPLITTFTVSWSSEPVDSFAPAIAWDETNAHYCVAYEQVFSAVDHDVVRTFVGPGGAFLSGAYVDTSLGDDWINPDVANNNDSNTFLVAAEVGLPSSGTRTIHGRVVDANTGVLGADVLISTADQTGEKVDVSIGGDPAIGYNTYTVVWRRIFTAGLDDDVHGRQVTALGTLVGGSTILIDNSAGTLDRKPRIAKSCEGPGDFAVVWERWNSASDRDVYAALVLFNGTIFTGSTAVVTGGADTTSPACSPIDFLGHWLLVYEYDYFTDHDIESAFLNTSLGVLDTLSLTGREDQLGAGTLFEDQVRPAADTDGNHFAYSYSESYLGSATDYDIYVSSVDFIGGNLMVGEFHQNLAFSSTHEDSPRMCSQQGAGGTTNRMGIVWSDTGGVNLGDIEGAVYGTCDFTKLCFALVDGVLPCPCANNPTGIGRGCDNSSATGGARLDGAGNASLAGDTAVFTTAGEKPTALSILAQGNQLSGTGIVFGQGRRCAAGALKRLYTHSAVGGSITAPSGADPSIHLRSAALGDPLIAGSVRYYYVYYRDQTVLGGCSAASTFNTSDTCQILWRP